MSSAGTDRLVELVRAEQAAAVAGGQEPALYGAKITGGGSGGDSRAAYLPRFVLTPWYLNRTGSSV